MKSLQSADRNRCWNGGACHHGLLNVIEMIHGRAKNTHDAHIRQVLFRYFHSRHFILLNVLAVIHLYIFVLILFSYSFLRRLSLIWVDQMAWNGEKKLRHSQITMMYVRQKLKVVVAGNNHKINMNEIYSFAMRKWKREKNTLVCVMSNVWVGFGGWKRVYRGAHIARCHQRRGFASFA